MNPQLSAYTAVLFLIIGLIAAWIMLEVRGSPKKRNNLRSLTLVHRVLGYLFVLIYLGMCGWMISKAGGYRQELSSRAAIHVGLAFFLAPAIGFKLLMVRRLKRFWAYLPVLGTLIFTTAFLLSVLTAGYYFLHHTPITELPLAGTDEKVLDERLGWGLLNENCAKCHALERVLTAKKSRAGWENTVIRMAEKDAPHLRPFEAGQIVLYLSPADADDATAALPTPVKVSGEALVQTKCAGCHDLDRVYRARKDRAAWRKTVDRMVENAEEMGEVDFLAETETEAIIQYLLDR